MSNRPLVDPSISLAGQTVVVTGSNTGIGKVTALELARAGAHVVLACRSQDKALAAIADIRAAVPSADVVFHPLNLANLRQTIESAQALLGGPKIDILVNNAGLAGAKGSTDDGFELAFGTNHMGPFAFTVTLLPHVKDGGRIVCVASRAHYRAKGIDYDAVRRPTQTATAFPEYAVSKFANVLFVRALAQRVASRRIDVYGLHPGVVASDIWRAVPWPFGGLAKLFMITNEEGARTSLYCATAPEAAGQTGLYWDVCKPKHPSRAAQSDEAAAELWQRSEAWLRDLAG